MQLTKVYHQTRSWIDHYCDFVHIQTWQNWLKQPSNLPESESCRTIISFHKTAENKNVIKKRFAFSSTKGTTLVKAPLRNGRTVSAKLRKNVSPGSVSIHQFDPTKCYTVSTLKAASFREHEEASYSMWKRHEPQGEVCDDCFVFFSHLLHLASPNEPWGKSEIKKSTAQLTNQLLGRHKNTQNMLLPPSFSCHTSYKFCRPTLNRTEYRLNTQLALHIDGLRDSAIWGR